MNTVAVAKCRKWRKPIYDELHQQMLRTAVIYSIIETAKANELDPYRYLCCILSTAPGLDHAVPNWVSPLLPANAPDACRK